MSGTATDSMGSSIWIGGFDASIPNMTPLQVAQHFCGADGSCTLAEMLAPPPGATPVHLLQQLGTFTATASNTPEPGTVSLIMGGIGLVALGGLKRRKRS
jgi:hypothetical protein